MKKGIKILIIVLALVIVGLVTYIIADKVIGNGSKKSTNTASSSSANSATSEVLAGNIENAKTNTADTTNSEKNGTSNNSNTTKTSTDSSKAGEKIAAALKERRFMAKNNIDINSDAKFMKVGDNIYFIEINDKSSGVTLTSLFTVTYKDGNAVFSKVEADKHAYTLSVDAKNHIVRAERTMKGMTSTIFYDVSEGTLDKKTVFGCPYEGYEDSVKYTVDNAETTKEDYEAKLAAYNKYNFVSFDDKAVVLNDANISNIVK